MAEETLLELQGLSRHFGGVRAVDGLDLAIRRGATHGLIGPNGAGKTTAFNLVGGLYPPSAGRVLYAGGDDITRLSAHRRASLGICRTFQTPRLFEEMTVVDTVMTGRHIHGRVGILGSMFSLRRKWAEEAANRAVAMRILERVGLAAQADVLAKNLSYGHRRTLEIARAMATEPQLLLLDEVTAGLNPVETAAVASLIRELAGEGVTILLVEHDMRFVMSLCDRITVLNFGRRIAEGTAQEIQSSEVVAEAYLGRSAALKRPKTNNETSSGENEAT